MPKVSSSVPLPELESYPDSPDLILIVFNQQQLSDSMSIRINRSLLTRRMSLFISCCESNASASSPHSNQLLQNMSAKIIVALSLLALVAVQSECRKIKFNDCGAGEIQSVDVDPCDKEPCMFKKNSIVHVVSDVIAKKNVAGGELKVTVLLGDVEVEYPGIESDICKLVSCPIKEGDKLNVALDIEVADYFPAVSISSIFDVVHYILTFVT